MKRIFFIVSAGVSLGTSLLAPFPVSGLEDDSSATHLFERDDTPRALFYLHTGDLKLLSGQFEEALFDFQQSAYYLSRAQQPLPSLEFLVTFGAAIAFDNLNQLDAAQHCTRACLALMQEVRATSPSSALKHEEIEGVENLILVFRIFVDLAVSPSIRSELSAMVDILEADMLHHQDLPNHQLH